LIAAPGIAAPLGSVTVIERAPVPAVCPTRDPARITADPMN
jgi:hypothetical protein